MMKVEFRNIFKRYDKVVAVDNLNLTIDDGALHFLLGPSGCGKTTILRMLAGLESVSEGKILFDGKDVTNLPAAQRGIGMVFQNYALWPHMTVRENIAYGLKLRKLTPEEQKKRLEEVLSITQLGPFAERLPGQLSGGQQQRVALARALAVRPSVLLLDEPLSNLDAKLRHEMRENITRIHKQTGITTLYVTHDQKEALSMGTSITVMRAGKSIQTGAPKELYVRPQSAFLASFIGETNLIPGVIKRVENNLALVETVFGNLQSSCLDASKLLPGSQCILSIRPESIKVCIDSDDFPNLLNRLNLKIDDLTYLGDMEQINLKSDGSILKANLFNPGLNFPKVGQMQDIRIHPQDILILPLEADLSSGT
jgi:ABC-type Fe3+/spermidine/putrescine transport system ATPase subunit